MQTREGRAFDLVRPRAADVCFHEIAHALACIPRFLGHTRGAPYSVAQHCVLGAEALLAETGDPTIARLFLLHDAHEAYLGDLTTPLQDALAAAAAVYDDETGAEGHGAWLVRKSIRTLKDAVDRAIFRAAGLEGWFYMGVGLGRVRAMDIRLLRAERDALMSAPPQPWHRSVEAAPPIPSLDRARFSPWPSAVAELAYRNKLQELLPHVLRRAA